MVISRYKQLLDKLPQAVFLCDKNFKIKYYNQSFIKVFEPKKSKGLMGSVFNCEENNIKCGQNDNCSLCEIRKAFADAIKKNIPIYLKRIIKNIKTRGVIKKISFNLTIKPISKNYFMGVVEDTMEVNLYNQMLAAKNIQQNMLPKGSSIAGNYFSYYYNPCGEIGGDLLDVFAFNNSACGFVADVSGKGIAAAMLASFLKAAFDKSATSLSKALIKINNKYKELKTDEREYITVLAVNIDEENKKVIYSVAGHNVPLLIKKGDTVKELRTNSPPISNWFDYFSYIDLKESYSEGNILVLLTDGITEAKNDKGERFGLQRVKNILNTSKNSKDFTNKIKDAVQIFTKQNDDDMTALAFDL
jgi:hypothetical protein